MADYLQDGGGDLAESALSDAPTTTVTMAMLFGSVIFTTATLSARLWLTGTWSWRNHDGQGGKSQPLDATSLPSVYSLLCHSTTFGLILFYSYVCENHPPYFHEEKTYDR